MQMTMRTGMKPKELRVEAFLAEMDAVVPWGALLDAIKPYYKSAGGRPPHEIEVMLRIHFLQLWHNLSDPAMEEALYDRLSFQKFLGFDCFGGTVPDESSICRFRHLLERHGLARKIPRIRLCAMKAEQVSFIEERECFFPRREAKGLLIRAGGAWAGTEAPLFVVNACK